MVRGGIIGFGAVVPIYSHNAVALVGIEGTQRLIHGYLLVVDSETMAVGVRVREEV